MQRWFAPNLGAFVRRGSTWGAAQRPVHDPVASVVMQGSGARVRDVMVAGAFRKKDGRLQRKDLPAIRAALARSGERILARLNVPSISRLVAVQ